VIRFAAWFGMGANMVWAVTRRDVSVGDLRREAGRERGTRKRHSVCWELRAAWRGNHVMALSTCWAEVAMARDRDSAFVVTLQWRRRRPRPRPERLGAGRLDAGRLELGAGGAGKGC